MEKNTRTGRGKSTETCSGGRTSGEAGRAAVLAVEGHSAHTLLYTARAVVNLRAKYRMCAIRIRNGQLVI
jgi:hypothetical protein